MLFGFTQGVRSTDYFFHPTIGDDGNNGLSVLTPFKSLNKIKNLSICPGDKINLAAGQLFYENLSLANVSGTLENKIIVQSFDWGYNPKIIPAKIISFNQGDGVSLKNCSYMIIDNIDIQAIGETADSSESMRCGVFVIADVPGNYEGIILKNLYVHDIFYNEKEISRSQEEVRSANGTQKYGWGIRFMVKNPNVHLSDLTVQNCVIENVSHTGIKFTTPKGQINNIKVYHNSVLRTGGPGIQMSGVQFGHISYNKVSYSGSQDDSRKWGRGSGLWTWNASDIIIEKNRFEYANGPGDSAGCHIDFYCRNVIVQYNISYQNAGGFCEILGNNFNCSYRYNISVNDGYRIKGEDGAFQEGKTFWLSGYSGKLRGGPYNSYFYNNTIYVAESIISKVAIDGTSEGILIANNIFYIKGKSMVVKGDQYNPEKIGLDTKSGDLFANNLFYTSESWPSGLKFQDHSPVYGNPSFVNEYGVNIEDFIPNNASLIKDKGIAVPKLLNDSIGIAIGLEMKFDILGNPIKGIPDIGAIEID